MTEQSDQRPAIDSFAPNGTWAVQYADGTWCPAGNRELLSVTDPSTREPIAEVPAGTTSDVDDAYRAAIEAQQPWAETPPNRRADVLRQLGERLSAHAEPLRAILRAEAGSTEIKCDFELSATEAIIHESASIPTRIGGDHRQSMIKGKENIVKREPAGIVTVISPWNYPLNLSLRAVAPAIAAGNAVVLKPASSTPISGGLAIARVFEETDLPEGVLNVVTGRGSDLGDHLAGHPDADVVAFTGSTKIGRHVAGTAANSMAFPAMELGGNSPHVVLEDADLDRAIDGGVYGTWLHQGQSCTTINRHLVHESIYDEYVSRLVDRATALPTGSAHDEDTIVGPLIHEDHRDQIRQYIDETVEAGATLETGGTSDGLVVAPTVLSDVTNEMSAACNEHFGPIAPVIPFSDDAEAIELANDTEFGLSASVCSGDYNRGMAVADAIDSGMVHVNDQSLNEEPHIPFGGTKSSGIGRYNGEEVIAEFTESRWVSVQRKPREYPF
jgi:aldehyde dehydrogenase (NAD+)